MGSLHIPVLPEMAPPRPYKPLPPAVDWAQSSTITAPHAVISIHHALTADQTVILYKFENNPETIRIADSSFPKHDLVSWPSAYELHVRCEATGHTIMVQTRNGAVTCFDLIAQLHYYFAEEIPREEWRDVMGQKRKAMKKAYQRRTGLVYSKSARMKRIDYFLGRTKFKRIVPLSEDVVLLQTY